MPWKYIIVGGVTFVVTATATYMVCNRGKNKALTAQLEALGGVKLSPEQAAAVAAAAKGKKAA